jgi:serine/threonine protein kinase
VGSPLFMPLEILERSMYSAKSDSFALGVIIYFLITKEYPWEGTSLNKLIRNCKERCIDWNKFELLPTQITILLQGLLSLDMKSRVSINSCDFSIF